MLVFGANFVNDLAGFSVPSGPSSFQGAISTLLFVQLIGTRPAALKAATTAHGDRQRVFPFRGSSHLFDALNEVVGHLVLVSDRLLARALLRTGLDGLRFGA